MLHTHIGSTSSHIVCPSPPTMAQPCDSARCVLCDPLCHGVHLSALVGGGALPCIFGSFLATSSSPSLSLGGGTSSRANVEAVKETCATSIGAWALAVHARCFQPSQWMANSCVSTNIIQPIRSTVCQCNVQEKRKRTGLTCLKCKGQHTCTLTIDISFNPNGKAEIKIDAQDIIPFNMHNECWSIAQVKVQSKPQPTTINLKLQALCPCA